MKYTFHIFDVFSSTRFGGNQLAVLPNAAGISTQGMQKIAREFNSAKRPSSCRRWRQHEQISV
jgi:predicted PhzF superfamily epimerase YddE/YHI9